MKYILILTILLTGCSSISGYLGQYNDANLKANVEVAKSAKVFVCDYMSMAAFRIAFPTNDDKIFHAKLCGYDLIAIPLRGE